MNKKHRITEPHLNTFEKFLKQFDLDEQENNDAILNDLYKTL
jgi:hypothetical protein